MNFRHHRNQGAQVNHTTRSAKAPSHRTGTFATRGAFAKGSGAPSVRLLAPLALVLAALLVLAAIPASALAAPPAEFGSEGPGAGQINEPRGIAVDQESGDLYVIDKFGFSGVLA